ncbi:protein of unknown function [Taphrina deformans PYCC 5710]|uniref:Thaumatin-like protein n=1 Tax=Taphrina deformans (strain PYCC 5710 / ATCC 11124 / CBS 356.35 / IMI 108563 / JCM 9778 / NBRC 8474) TaxID=1097556 RepID=R4XFA3_TAPDE|nr:protein of unknown function [Taphrina deformans PYCC 5710]|eukprot:CCG84461.1 protein of unknown function [Taphrina deformans PYCC 5710]
MQFSLSAITAIAAFASSVIAAPVEARSTGVYTITVKNSCSQTIWPGVGQVSSSPGKIDSQSGGFELASGGSRTISVPTDWIAGRIFARTGCSGSGSSFHCAVGDCGAYSCVDNTGISGVTLAEFSYSDMVKTFYNISLISGYNLGMRISSNDATCPAFSCPTGGCSEFQAYKAGSGANPCAACPLAAAYTVEFCPS